MEIVTDVIFLGSKITVDSDCSHEIKRRHFPLGIKAMTNLDSILKSRDITSPMKVCIVKAMVFPVAMYRCEIWIIKQAEHQRIDAFEHWCWRRLLRVPWTARRSNQSIQKRPSCWESLRAGGERGWRIRWLDGITDSKRHEFEQTPGGSEEQGNLACCSPGGLKVRHS